ncbi:hypothetical protein F7725_024511 [Dissostichus mawsoni]|uniref:SNRNP25 ubiquitin-like domain-containing protein n=1 Tax=Dissostichus mawsoni TaxID=36200 RepID=A0A7J5XZQ1_DISMA|nr:hypothetical protein F7725_024511 [Dissostichus mawsoni]
MLSLQLRVEDELDHIVMSNSEGKALLIDLFPKVNLEEVNSQIALEYGQAMTVRVLKTDGEIMPIVVVQNATVLDLKKAIADSWGGNNNVKAE